MTFKEVYERALARMGDTSYFHTGSPSRTTLTDVKAEVNDAYVQAVNILAEHHFYGLVNSQNVSWSAGTREKDLLTTLTTKPRKIISVAIFPSADAAQEPVPAVFPWRGSPSKRNRRYAGIAWAYYQMRGYASQYEMYFKGEYNLGFYINPTQDQLVEIMSAPVCETLSTDGAVPAQVPVEHHGYIAQQAAIILSGGVKSADQFMLRELEKQEERLRTVAPNVNQYSPNVPGIWSGY